MKVRKIITHAGQFHADEVMACAIVRSIYPEIELERKFQITQEEMNDPSILVIDVGREFNADKGNFDHHQDSNLNASNVLIFDCLKEEIISNFEDDSWDAKNRWDFFEHCLNPLIDISDRDCGLKQDTSFNFNTIIRNFNSFENEKSFEMAVKLASTVFMSILQTAAKAVESKILWENLEKINSITKIQKTDKVLVNWKEFAEAEGILLLITPNNRGGWQIISRDSSVITIPEDHRQTFRHNSGFMAVYPTLEDCLDIASILEMR